MQFVVGIAELDLSSMLGLCSEAKDLNHMVMVSDPDLAMGCSIALDTDWGMAMDVLRHFQHYVVAS